MLISHWNQLSLLQVSIKQDEAYESYKAVSPTQADAWQYDFLADLEATRVEAFATNKTNKLQQLQRHKLQQRRSLEIKVVNHKLGKGQVIKRRDNRVVKHTAAEIDYKGEYQ